MSRIISDSVNAILWVFYSLLVVCNHWAKCKNHSFSTNYYVCRAKKRIQLLSYTLLLWCIVLSTINGQPTFVGIPLISGCAHSVLPTRLPSMVLAKKMTFDASHHCSPIAYPKWTSVNQITVGVHALESCFSHVHTSITDEENSMSKRFV